MADTPKKGAGGVLSFLPRMRRTGMRSMGMCGELKIPLGKKVWVSVYSELQSD